jgi:hypothetical protein
MAVRKIIDGVSTRTRKPTMQNIKMALAIKRMDHALENLMKVNGTVQNDTLSDAIGELLDVQEELIELGKVVDRVI